MRTSISVFAFTLILEFFVDRTDQFNRYDIEAVGEEKEFLLAGCIAEQKSSELVQVILLNALALIVIDWERIAVEVDRHLVE